MKYCRLVLCSVPSRKANGPVVISSLSFMFLWYATASAIFRVCACMRDMLSLMSYGKSASRSSMYRSPLKSSVLLFVLICSSSTNLVHVLQLYY